MPQFKVRPGEQFKDADGSIKAGGDTIELDAEMAALHRDKVDPVVSAADLQQGHAE